MLKSNRTVNSRFPCMVSPCTCDVYFYKVGGGYEGKIEGGLGICKISRV